MATAPVSSAIVGDPTWLCHRYDPQLDSFHYRKVDRSVHRSVAFLIDAELGPDANPVIIGRSEATALLGPPAPLHFIFHSAFCGSTMLTRTLDVEGSAMGLSEPVVLNDFVGWRRRGASSQQLGSVLGAAMAQLARPWSPGESVVVKPSNVFNGLAGGALLVSPQSRAIVLTAPLPVFLASVARKGLNGRLWVRELLDHMLQDGLVDLGFEAADYLRQTDLQVAAVGWLAQQVIFLRLCERFGPDRVATLDSERLTTAPAETLATAARFLGLKQASEADYAQHAALLRDSKSGATFSPGQRQQDRLSAEQAHGDEIGKVAAWAAAVATNAGVQMNLPYRLT